MGIKRNIYFFGQSPIPGVDHIPLQTTKNINPYCDLSKYDFIIVTSKRAIEAMLSFDYDLSSLDLYCIGNKTADFAKKQGLTVVYISQGYAKDLISEIKPMIAGQTGLYLRPKKVANTYITEEVEKGNLDQALCYETLCIEKKETNLKHPAVFLFAAPSQIACFKKHYSFKQDDIAIAIGTTTYAALPFDIEKFVSDEPTLESLYQKAREFV